MCLVQLVYVLFDLRLNFFALWEVVIHIHAPVTPYSWDNATTS